MEFGLTDGDILKIKSVFANCASIDCAILYGSRAKGNYRTNSDIDITLKGDDLSYKDFINVSLALDDLFTPYDFDLPIYSDIENEALLSHINRVGKVLYQKS